MSLSYQNVILNALKLAMDSLDVKEEELRKELEVRMKELIDGIRFHDGREFVPTIRSYNFVGQAKRKSIVNNIAGVKDNGLYAMENLNLWDMINALNLFEDTLYTDEEEYLLFGYRNEQQTPRVRNQRIFDNAYAYSWVGNRVRLGSINQFPVIPGSYQHPTWGLGWQSYPVTFLVEEEQFSFLRWYVALGDTYRTHPAEGYNKSYLSPALFRENLYPKVETWCRQSENVMVSVRSMTGVNHCVSEITDEWLIQNFTGIVSEFDMEAEGITRQWVVLRYANAVVAITALQGIRENENNRTRGRIVIEEKEECLKLRQVLYIGEDQRICKERLEAGWLVVAYDTPLEDVEKVKLLLSNLRIDDKSILDGEVPRSPYQEIRDISVRIDGKMKLNFQLDPHTGLV